jgi:hypothetical protein
MNWLRKLLGVSDADVVDELTAVDIEDMEAIRKGGCVIERAVPDRDDDPIGDHYVYKTIESRRLQRATPPPAMTPEQELQHLELVALRKHVDPFDTSRERLENVSMNSFRDDIRRRWQQRCVWTGVRVFWYWLPWELAKLAAVLWLAWMAWVLVS